MSKIEKSGSSKEINNSLAAIGQPIKGANPWFLFIMALIVTIISAIIVLLIKLRFYKIK